MSYFFLGFSETFQLKHSVFDGVDYTDRTVPFGIMFV